MKKSFLILGILIIVGGAFLFFSLNNVSNTEDTDTDSTLVNAQTGKKVTETSTQITEDKKSVSEEVETENDVLEKTRQLLISRGELPKSSTIDDVKEYMLPPLQGRPFVSYCEDSFVLQHIGGEYHKLEYFSSTSFNKINECEDTWGIGEGPNPSCSVGESCIPVRDFVYPLILTIDKSSYKYGDEIIVTLMSNENRNETVYLDNVVGPYCAGLSFERIGKSSNDWIKDSIERQGSQIDSCDNITISPTVPFILKIHINDTNQVPSGKWRVVHESDAAYLTAGFWLVPLE